jgi:hypothetical protein
VPDLGHPPIDRRWDVTRRRSFCRGRSSC